MKNTAYDLISKSFEDQDNPRANRIELASPKLTIQANRLRSKDNSVLLSEVWFKIKTEVTIKRAQIESALSLITEDSKLIESAKTIFTARKSTQQEIQFDDFINRYIAESSTLRSISDKPPTTSINDRIIDGSVEVPSHAWSSYFAAFEAYDEKHPEFGMAWDSTVLYRDGIALRKAQQANVMHALLPQTAEIMEGVEFGNALEEATAIQKLVASDKDAGQIKSINDIFRKISKTPEPVILPAEINRMGEFASELLQEDISKLEYSTSSKWETL